MGAWSLILCAFGALALVAGLALHWVRRRGRPAAMERVGRYEILGVLGEGGMGTVLEGRHPTLGRPTAIKLAKAAGKPAAAARFEREARITSELAHPGVVTLYDHGHTDEGVPWIALELVDGISLDRLIRDVGSLSARRVHGILLQLASALAHVHERDIVHRDVKPSNVMLSRQGGACDAVKLIDFGLAKRLTPEARAQARTSIVGTPLFMAPESSDPAAEVGPEVDVYGVGMVGYALLTGTFLFGDHDPGSLARAHLREPPLPPSLKTEAPVPADLERVILSCLEKDPRARFADGGDLLRALHACQVPPIDAVERPAPRTPMQSGTSLRERDTVASPIPLVRKRA